MNTSSDAVGIILPLHIAELLQLPDVIGHLFGIYYFPLKAAIVAAVVCTVEIDFNRSPIVFDPVKDDTA
jgi:hypothetical protein